jgi:NAD(P)-dependent dehydrogenase (short-subunit alcohol dehydrogenase family)
LMTPAGLIMALVGDVQPYAVQRHRQGKERHMEMQGQVAIVTGAGRGIGRATALELARLGANIVVAELDRTNAESTASELRGLGRRALVLQTDVTSRDDLRAMVEQTRAEFGRIDALVNNAGISIARRRHSMSPRNTGTQS